MKINLIQDFIRANLNLMFVEHLLYLYTNIRRTVQQKASVPPFTYICYQVKKSKRNKNSKITTLKHKPHALAIKPIIYLWNISC